MNLLVYNMIMKGKKFMEHEPTANAQPYPIRYKPVTTAPKTPNEPQGRDTFQTPNYATDLIIPYIPKSVKRIWEPAAGEGRLAGRLEQSGYRVWRSDIRKLNEKTTIYNFISEEVLEFPIDGYNLAIITNPPFSIKEEFIERCLEYNIPWALLINADYSGKQIDWIKRGCEKLIPNRRIDFITPTGRNGKTSSSQFHTMWLTYGFNLGKTETFVELSLKDKKENI